MLETILIAMFLGFVFGFAIALIFLSRSFEPKDPEQSEPDQGRIIARNDRMDEIMVVYGNSMARYKRVVE